MKVNAGVGVRAGPAPAGYIGLRLYVAAEAPNSVRAVANLIALCARCGQNHGATEVIDVIAEPQRALRDGVLVTPMLVRFAPPPEVRIVGDLSEARRVAQALGWTEECREE
jgi:circadian clock protein KaiB